MSASQNHPHGLPRWFEVLAALLGLVLVSPLMVVCALGVKLSSPGPVIFRQKRVGQGGRPFFLLKFRSMRVGERGPQVTRSGDARVTRFGRWLRKLKLDELPELWNVVRGDMALVGPRPEVPEYVNLQDPLWQEVLVARPGITDPVTLRLRNEEELLAQASDSERFYLEVLQRYKLKGYLDYLRCRTWWSDVGVLGKSVWAVLFSVSAPPPDLQDICAQVLNSGNEQAKASKQPWGGVRCSDGTGTPTAGHAWRA